MDIEAVETEARLRRLKPEVADHFAAIQPHVAARLSAPEFERWANLCWQLADSGWHGWETANDYIGLSKALVAASRLLEVGDYCVRWVGASFEPGRTYLRGIASMLGEEDFRGLSAIHETGLVLLAQFQHASNMHTQYFKAAFAVDFAQDQETLGRWCEMARQHLLLERAEVLKFLELSCIAPGQNWQVIADMAQLHRQNALDYLAFTTRVSHFITPVEDALVKQLLGFSKRLESAGEWLLVFEKNLPRLTEVEARTLMQALAELDCIDAARALTETADKLPLAQPAVLFAWLARMPAGENLAAMVAYLRLESAFSEQVLEQLLGQVLLEDEVRKLQLFAEAMSSSRLKIEASDELPGSDGQVLKLPTIVAESQNRDENFRWLKTALTHQLGCYEFGTFEFRRENSYVAFESQFGTYDQPILAETLFAICEAARVDWQIAARYRGAAKDLSWVKQQAISQRAVSGLSPRHQLLEAMIQYSLDATGALQFVEPAYQNLASDLFHYMNELRSKEASVHTSMEVLAYCYSILSATPVDLSPIAPVRYRGAIAFDDASINLQLTALDEMDPDFNDNAEDTLEMTGSTDASDMDVDELEAGEVDNPSAVMVADDETLVPDDLEQLDDPAGLQKMERLKQAHSEPPEITYRYDEWDHNIADYRRRWCTLYEYREVEQDVDFVPNTLADHRALLVKVRRQLNMLRPELLRKVKGVVDGEELDLERAIEAVVDRKSGISPAENIYVQRQRKERDVAALFLLDMSASTDDLVEAEAPVLAEEADDYLQGYDPVSDVPDKQRGQTILDLEKASVVLMAEALEGLGDAYAVCGFSGYGREQVEFYVCKDFDEPYNYHAKANIGGIKPCRSTRMGPAIRHATKMLAETESRIKALIIISDGYPQDFDYGQDRNSKDYGVKDTTKALSEASQKGVQSFCLTVDPSGHDYLRDMCPDQSYMVMQDITQLPDELSKVYRGLTT